MMTFRVDAAGCCRQTEVTAEDRGKKEEDVVVVGGEGESGREGERD